MKEYIKEEIKVLLRDGQALDFIEICNLLGYDKEMDNTISEVLTTMVNNYELSYTNKKKYMLFEKNEKNKDFYKGIFLDTKGTSGFVQINGMEDVYIHSTKRLGAMENDEVLVHLVKKALRDRKAEGEIVAIIKRDLKNKVGEIYHFKKKVMVSLDDKKFKKLVYLEDNKETRRLVDGDKVLVSLTGIVNDKEYVKAKLIKRIGHINDPGIDILSMILEHEIKPDFSEEAIKELENIPTKVNKMDLKGVRDLRDKMIFTIDGDDTKDIDDAISLEMVGENYKLGVHIAHVSYYIKEDSKLDLEARNRGTSTYLVDRVIPMFPHQISNGICSLNPEEDRLTITCEMEISKTGKVVNYEIYPSVIKSRIQMTYKKVNEILEKDKVPKYYGPYKDTLLLMNELAHIIRKERTRRGAIDFDTDEAKILVDENCVPYDVTLRGRGEGERLIEDFMIMANETVASHLYFMELPSIYRVHGEPKEDRLIKFLNIIENLGIHPSFDIKKMSSKLIQKLVNELKEYTSFKVLSTKLLSSMDKAVYSENNTGHFALASKIYTHFTSPIRRYPDLMVHRLLDDYFFSSDGITDEKIRHYGEILPGIALTSSECEQNSEECERDVEDMKMAEYMENHLNEEYNGMISGITNFGFFVMLDNMIEGLVSVDTFSDTYNYDKNNETLKVGSKLYRLGDKVRVKVIRASKEASEIDFEIVERCDDKNEKIKKED